MSIKADWKLNIPSFLVTAAASAAGCLAAFFLLQGDVKALSGRMDRVERNIEKLEIAREADRALRLQDREAILTIQGDVRVVRQMLEGMRPGATPR
jgi:hypothetical protein